MSEFRKVMGESDDIKVLEIFIEWRGIEVCTLDICENTNLDAKIVEKETVKLDNAGMIKPTTKGFTINEENEKSKEMITKYDEIITKTLMEYETYKTYSPEEFEKFYVVNKIHPKVADSIFKMIDGRACLLEFDEEESEIIIKLPSFPNSDE